ncbi:hypothetical protein LTR64_002111 [Lithohypha guttulata]|uniref:uncharacterized protein n=1 Tax=Lithohypha guttulata TaxID=1690604 RepID=UPI002DDDE7F1|nr:hypothetical protein LTR51_007969 [Lithohypha guttulata]
MFSQSQILHAQPQQQMLTIKNLTTHTQAQEVYSQHPQSLIRVKRERIDTWTLSLVDLPVNHGIINGPYDLDRPTFEAGKFDTDPEMTLREHVQIYAELHWYRMGRGTAPVVATDLPSIAQAEETNRQEWERRQWRYHMEQERLAQNLLRGCIRPVDEEDLEWAWRYIEERYADQPGRKAIVMGRLREEASLTALAVAAVLAKEDENTVANRAQPDKEVKASAPQWPHLPQFLDTATESDLYLRVPPRELRQ